jgi:hypothetical protein
MAFMASNLSKMENILKIDEALKPEFDMMELTDVLTNTLLTFTVTARQVFALRQIFSCSLHMSV